MKRLVLKSISYRVLSLAISTSVGWAVTGSLTTGLMTGGIDAVFKIGMYAAHEMAWSRMGEAVVETAVEAVFEVS